ncbi:TIGR01621 family pseudouridine synthase [Denitratisoma sp. agr-D3]
MSLTLLARHEDFVVVVKPAGMSFHRDDADAGLLPAARQLTGLETLYPVHRLDRVTSGLVLLARSEDAARQFGTLFAEGQVEKYYLALSRRPPAKKQGTVKGAMSKGRNGSWRLARQGETWAVTQFFSYGLPEAAPGLRLFLLRPRTGRTHQLRVAMKSLGSPILGDERYGGEEADRAYLHAYTLRFPWRGELLSYRALPTEGRWFLDPTLTAKLASLGPPEDQPWPGETAADKATKT